MHEVALAQARISWSRIKHNFKEDDFLKNSKIYIVIYIEYLHSFLNLIYFVSLEFNKFFKCNKILIILKSIFVNIYFFLDIFFFFLLKEDSNSHHNYVIHLLQYCYLSLFVYEPRKKAFPLNRLGWLVRCLVTCCAIRMRTSQNVVDRSM